MKKDASGQLITPFSEFSKADRNKALELYMERVERDGTELLYVVKGNCGHLWCRTTQEIGYAINRGTTIHCPICD